MSKLAGQIITTLLLILLVGFGVAQIFAYDKVTETEYGLKYSNWDKSLQDDSVYTAGRYYVGFTGEFLKFPSTQQTLDFTSLHPLVRL